MQLLKSGFRSGKIATFAGLSLAVLYVVPEFIDGARESHTQSTSAGVVVQSARQDAFDLAKLDDMLSRVDYRLDDIRRGEPVPRLYVEQIPVDIDSIPDVDERKNTFIKLVLPLILNVNEQIAEQRQRLNGLLQVKAVGKSLAETDRQWLEELAAGYRTDASDPFKLLDRVDTVPVSIALAQAVEESGWGASRFVREGNALFGQRTWASGDGIVPEERERSDTHEVKSFDSVAESISAYVHNLNTHPAYEDFRKARAALQDGPDMSTDRLGLAATLRAYSEKGLEYVNNLRNLIKTNRLQDFETAELAP